MGGDGNGAPASVESTNVAPTTGASSPSLDVDYMSYVSHELSAPLTAMRWSTALLQSAKMTKPLDPDQLKLADEIMVGVNRMSLLVDDIHESSWLERGKFADQPSPISLADVIANVQAKQQAAIDGKKLVFTVTIDPTLPPLTVRPSTITLVVQNLLSNAVKYTPAGGSVTVQVRIPTEAEAAKLGKPAAGCVLLSLADTGMGIPADQQQLVFSRFFRASNVREQDLEGTGLGLYIVSLGVKSMGGATWFQSVEQQGSTFYVLLPLKNAADEVH